MAPGAGSTVGAARVREEREDGIAVDEELEIGAIALAIARNKWPPMARFKSHRRSNRRARLRSCIAPHVAVHVLRALEVLIMLTKGRLCVSGRLPPAPSPSGVPYLSYCPRGGGAVVVRLLKI